MHLGSRYQAIQRVGAYGCAYQPQGGVAYSRGHAAYLAVASFGNAERKPGGGFGSAYADGWGAGSQRERGRRLAAHRCAVR